MPQATMGPDPFARPLFGSLPPLLFRVFSREARWFYANLLEHLEREAFGDAGEVISRKTLIETIEEFAGRRDRAAEFDAEEGGPGQEGRGAIAYRRLVETGWLIEHRDRYRRIVDMEANARVVLQTLLEIKAGRTRSYGGEVLQVLILLESAKADPDSRSEAVRNAARASRGFMRHLRAVAGSMRQVEEMLMAQTSLRSMFRTFFEDFVERHLVEDFKRLKSSTNPFRFRQRIIDVAEGMLGGELTLKTLAEAYAREGRCEDAEEGRTILVEELGVVLSVFERIGDHLDLIEETNQRLERRMANTVRFMDRIAETKSERLIEAMRALGQSPIPMDAEIDVPHCLITADFVRGPENLHQYRRKGGPIAPRKVRRDPPDPAFLAFSAALAEYRGRAVPTPRVLDQWLERAMGTRREIGAEELPLQTLDDFFAFERLRLMPHNGESFLPRWIFDAVTGKAFESEWLECAYFRIRRNDGAANARIG